MLPSSRARNALFALAFLCFPAFAHAANLPLVVEHPHALVMEGIPNGAGYMELTNPNATEDAIVGARSDCCDAVELHTHLYDGEAMRMRKMDQLILPAKGMLPFAKGGHHLMLIGLKKTYRTGDAIPITLEFQQAPDMDVRFPVEAR